MAQQANLNTVTIVTRSNNTVSILTRYEALAESVEIELYSDSELFGGIQFIEGQLRITKDGYNNIDFAVDSEGVGVIYGSSRVNEFSVNTQGELIHTIP